jgi:hypothetical protein
MTISAAVPGFLFVEGLERPNQKKQGNILDRVIKSYFTAYFVTGFAGHESIHKDNIGQYFFCLLQCGVSVVDNRQVVILIGEYNAYYFLNGDTVIGEEHFVAHVYFLRRETWQRRPIDSVLQGKTGISRPKLA